MVFRSFFLWCLRPQAGVQNTLALSLGMGMADPHPQHGTGSLVNAHGFCFGTRTTGGLRCASREHSLEHHLARLDLGTNLSPQWRHGIGYGSGVRF